MNVPRETDNTRKGCVWWGRGEGGYGSKKFEIKPHITTNCVIIWGSLANNLRPEQRVLNWRSLNCYSALICRVVCSMDTRYLQRNWNNNKGLFCHLSIWSVALCSPLQLMLRTLNLEAHSKVKVVRIDFAIQITKWYPNQSIIFDQFINFLPLRLIVFAVLKKRHGWNVVNATNWHERWCLKHKMKNRNHYFRRQFG